ncbi:39S mitochondrial ribosomal protein L46-domain-containing protein [Podospora fimiseda]|uniref:Large ribosomal subunit protein mL46 n=1 Tax=Podospora fimiseda TaxID=252190 RepID=A0AAN7BWK8_9PEZI|nr:39S mitochondrial ribosomal protein L46-domain-containing protein [Podospora fimiseda]
MMSAPGRRGSALLLRSSSRRAVVCLQCASIPTQFYSAEAAATQPTITSTTTTPPPPLPTKEKTLPKPNPYLIKSGVILSRPPILTRLPTPFEASFYLYQKRLNERLSAPFRKDFYFKQDTALDLDWRIKLKERHGVPAKDIGRYNPRGRMAWNDEVLVGSTTSDPQHIVETLLKDAEVRVSEDGEEIAPEERIPVERPMPRTTEADEKNDVRRLDRRLDETLYLVVKRGEENEWGFPEGQVPTQEALHETAQRILTESAGPNMNTWIVGRVPVAHRVSQPDFEEDGKTIKQRGEKVFYLKGRIMAGQADLTDNKHGLTDFKWLTKNELKETLSKDMWDAVKNMLDLR